MIVAETQCSEPEELYQPRSSRMRAQTAEHTERVAAEIPSTAAAAHVHALRAKPGATDPQVSLIRGLRSTSASEGGVEDARRKEATPESGKLMHTFTRQKRKTPESARGGGTAAPERCKKQASDPQLAATAGADVSGGVSDDAWQQIAADSLPQEAAPPVAAPAAEDADIGMETASNGADAEAKALQSGRAASHRAALAALKIAGVSKLPASRKLRGAAERSGKATAEASRPEEKPGRSRAATAQRAAAAETPQQTRTAHSRQAKGQNSAAHHAETPTPIEGRPGMAAEVRSSGREDCSARPGTAERRRIPSRLQPWPCPACTFENASAAPYCEMCDEARPPPTARESSNRSALPGEDITFLAPILHAASAFCHTDHVDSGMTFTTC